MSPRLQTAALLAVSVSAAGMVAEAGLRWWGGDLDPHPEWHYEPRLGWVQNPGHRYVYAVDGEEVEVAYNSLGFRDVERAVGKHPGLKRVVLVGDSFSAAVEVNQRDTFARRLERTLNTYSNDPWEVINLGVGDFGTAQQYLALEHYGLAYRPDVVVHQIFPLNDICNNSIELAGLCKSTKDGYRPYFVVSGDGLRPASAQPLRGFLRRRLYSYRLVEKALHRLGATGEPQVDGAEYDRLVAEAGLPPLAPLLYTYVDTAQQIEPVARGWQVTERLVERIAARCRELGIAYLPVVIPFHARVGETWTRFAASQPPPAMIQDYPEQRLGTLFERLEVPGILMKEVFERHTGVLLPPRGGHLNPGAHRLVAQAIYRQMVGHGLVSEDPEALGSAAASEDPAAPSTTDGGREYTWGTTIEFGEARAVDYLAEGWGEPEGPYRWSVAQRAVVLVRTPPPGRPVLLRANVNAFLVPGQIDHQTVRIRINGRPAGEWSLSEPGFHEQVLRISPALLAERQPAELAFEMPGAASPESMGVSRDLRTLAVAIASLTLSELQD